MNTQDEKPGSTLRSLLSPFESFIRDTSIASLFLFACVICALVIANSPFAATFNHLLETQASVFVGDFGIRGSLHHWVNDGLMVVFFFLLGLEIKREVLVGDLKDPRRAVPVAAAALGGMLVPAAIYLAFNAGGDYAHGWGIPMATDAAFALGVLALLGRDSVPGLAAFLTALAIVDDMGAVTVIAVFYSDDIALIALVIGAAILACLVALNIFGVRHPGFYLAGAIALWIAMLGSGVHTTTAGILAALAVPARPRKVGHWLTRRIRRLSDAFEQIEERRAAGLSILANKEQHAIIERLESAAEQASTPLQRWERVLERPIAYFVLPLFALMNAGVALNAATIPRVWSEPVGLGIMFGLVAGKVIGVVGGTWLAIRLGLGKLPDGMNLRHTVGVGLLGGIGFTMSIFIASLGLSPGSAALETAKIAILSASLLAGTSGYLWLKFACRSADGA
jgi:NhaA family Na+:H+ antiporter